MAIYVNTNVSSLTGRNSLNNVQNNLTTTYQRLSTGMRINSAKDDAAGLQIADRLTTQINGLNQGNRNASDGIALAQTAEGALDEISSMLQKVRTLAVQASTGTLTSDDRAAIQKESDSLVAEITRIATQTTYGGKTILEGGETTPTNTMFEGDNKAGTLEVQVGANSGDKVTIRVESFVFSQLLDNANIADMDSKSGLTTGTLDGVDDRFTFALGMQSKASAAITTLDALISQVDEQRADLGAIQNRLESSIRNQSNIVTNESDARSRIRDADFAEESANLSLCSCKLTPVLSWLCPY